MNIYLVRHGESEGNADRTVHETVADHAISLSPRGTQQAEQAGTILCNYLKERSSNYSVSRQRTRLWTSPYKRTRETADGIMHACADIIGGSPREHALLCEQQFGLFDGVPTEKLPQRFPLEHAHYKKQEQFGGKFWARMPLGESRFDVATRVHQAFGTFHRDHDRHGIDTVVVVCHGVTLRAFVMMWLHLPVEWFEEEPNPNNCAIRLLSHGEDMGYIFEGFPRGSEDN